MSTRTPREDSGPPTGPISRVDNRVLTGGTANCARFEERMALSRRIVAAFVIEAKGRAPGVRTIIEVPGFGDLLLTEIAELELYDDPEADGMAYTLSFEYRGRRPLEFVSDSDEVYARLRKSLFEYGLQFKSGAGPTVKKLSIEPRVPASVRIAADVDGGQITMCLHNVSALGTVSYAFPVTWFERAVVDALVDMIVGRPQEYQRLVSTFVKQR